MSRDTLFTPKGPPAKCYLSDFLSTCVYEKGGVNLNFFDAGYRHAFVNPAKEVDVRRVQRKEVLLLVQTER